MTTWVFEGGMFRVHRGVFGTGSPGQDGCNGPKFESGSFKVTTKEDIVTLAYAYSSAHYSDALCRTRSFRVLTDCQHQLKLSWLSQGENCSPNGRETVLYLSGTPNNVDEHASARSQESPVLLQGESWTGTIALHTTNCTIDLNLAAVSDGIYAWQADVHGCRIGPDLAVEEERARRGAHSPKKLLSVPSSTVIHSGKRQESARLGMGGPYPYALGKKDYASRLDETSLRDYSKTETRSCCSDLSRLWRLPPANEALELPEHSIPATKNNISASVDNISTTVGISNRIIFDVLRHSARDILPTHMCVHNYSNMSGLAPEMEHRYVSPSPPVRRPSWGEMEKMPRYGRANDSYTSCASIVPTGCHPQATCAVKFQSPDVIRDASNPDASYDSYFQDCLDRVDGVVVRLNPGQGCSHWNATTECVCDRGYVGNGKCCEDRQVLLCTSLSCMPPSRTCCMIPRGTYTDPKPDDGALVSW